MLNILQEENISHYFNEIEKPVDNNFIYGYVTASLFSSLIGPFISFAMQFYIISFFLEEVVLVEVGLNNKFIEKHFIIPKEKIIGI